MSIYLFFAFPVDATWANTVVAAGHALRWAMWGSLFDVGNRRWGSWVAEESFLLVWEFSFVLLIASGTGTGLGFDKLESCLVLSDVLVGYDSTWGRILDVPVDKRFNMTLVIMKNNF